MKSAFLDKVRCSDDYFTVDAPEYHSVAYATGGIGQLYCMIKNDDVPPLPEIGYHTDSNGHFTPKGKCLLGLRYNVVKILDAKGQSAVLVEAEDLFCSNIPVVIKVLHSHYYQLGGQESHVLRKLAVADPNNYSHTLRLLTTLTMDAHYCLVFEPMLPDPLTRVFSAIPSSKILTDIRRVGLRLLTSLAFLHQQNLIHTDLKPENILLKHEHDLDSVHIVDFGNAINFVHSEVSLYYKDFDLQTPLYRAPEVMYGIPFGPEIDIWSLGCILAELFLGKPLFLGCTQTDILKQMYELLGSFPTKLFRRGKYYPSLRTYTGEENQDVCTFKLMEFMQCNDYHFADLVSGMLRYDPEERLTASEAARHSFFASHLPLGFLFPNSKGGSPYSAVSLTKDTYQLSPYVPPSIKRQPLTSVDLLKQGTIENSNMDKSLMKPSPKLRRFRGDYSSITTKGSNLFTTSRGSNSDGKKSGFTNPWMNHSNEEIRSKPSDVSVVRQFVHGAKIGEKYSENVKDKMSSLLQAIREEQVSVENDLDRRNDMQGTRKHKNRSKHKTRTVMTLQRPCPRYGKLGHTRGHSNSVQNSELNSPGTHILSQTGNNEHLHKKLIGAGNGDNYEKEYSNKNCKTDGDYYETFNEKVLRSQQDTVHKPSLKQAMLPGRYETNRTIPSTQNSSHKKTDSVHKEHEKAQSTSTSYCSGSDVSMDSESCLSGMEDDHHDSVDVENSKHQVYLNRKQHTLTPSSKEHSKPIMSSPCEQIDRYSNTMEGKDTVLDGSFDHKHKIFEDFGSQGEAYPRDMKPDLMTEPSNQDFVKRTSRKRVASVSVSDDDEYLELMSPPSAMKSERKKVKSGSHSKRRQSLDTCSIENDRKYSLKDGKSTTLKRISPSTKIEHVRFIRNKYHKNDKANTVKDKHTDIPLNDQRHKSKQGMNENEKYKFQVAARSDLKPSARSYVSRCPTDPLLTPIQKFSSSVTDSIASPEIVYKVKEKEAIYGESKIGDDRKSLTYHHRFRSNPSPQADTKPSSEKHRPSKTVARNADTKHEYVKGKSGDQARSMEKKYTETIVKDIKSEVSGHDDFSFRSTPETDHKHYKSESGIADRIAKINMKFKKPARKSLQFEYSDNDVQPVNRVTDVSDAKRNQISLGNNSEIIRSYGSKDFFAEKHKHGRSYSNNLIHREQRISDDRMRESVSEELHDEVENTHVNHFVSPENAKPKSKQEQIVKRAVSSGSDRFKFQRSYIPKNDTTFTIEFESPVH